MGLVQRKILVVEDEASIRGFLKINLNRSNFIVAEAQSGEEGLRIARMGGIDVAILDVMLPGIDGFAVCETLRKELPGLGIIMLTAKGQDMDKITGLECGADDYMVKPFNPTELVLRVKSLLRRMERPKEEKKIIEYGPFAIDTSAQKLYKNGMEIDLTPTEYAIIRTFIENPGKALKRDDLLDMVWGFEFVGDPKIVDVNIRRLRAKIEEDPSHPEFINTIWGTGYRWSDKYAVRKAL